MFFGFIKVRRLARKISVTLLVVFCGLNWFARQPYEFQQKLYRHLPAAAVYRVYYLSNVAASITDFAGLTGSDCFVEFEGDLPLDGPLIGGLPLESARGRAPGGVQYLKRSGFTVCYSPELRHPLWVAVKVPAGERLPETPRPPFKRDPAAENCPAPGDYAKSGYDRGHMAPNRAVATGYGADAQRESFLLSNISPQRPGLNRGPWRRIEHMISDVWPERYGDIYVITGTHSDEKSERLPSGINVPDGFYKIAVARRGRRLYALAVYMSQSTGFGAFPRTKIVSVDELEAMTGLDFLSELPDDIEKPLEAGKPTRLWPTGWRGWIRLAIAHFRKFD
jgi:endonuclease G, mitochondrial